MSDTKSQNSDFLRVERGALYATRPSKGAASSRPRHHEPPDVWLDRRMAEVFASWRANNGDGALASVAIKQASEGYQWPHRKMGKRMREARQQRVSRELLRKVGDVFHEYADRLYDRPITIDPAA